MTFNEGRGNPPFLFPRYRAISRRAISGRTGNIPTGYRIALTARESTPPNPMIAVSSNNQTIGVILEFIRHLLVVFVCRQTDMHTVYNKRGNGKRHSCSRSAYYLKGGEEDRRAS